MSPDMDGAPDSDGGVTLCISFVGAGESGDNAMVDASRAVAL